MSEWREERKPEWEKKVRERIEEEAKILTDLTWNTWKQLLHGREPEKPSYKELRGVAEYYLRKCREYGVAPETIDFTREIAELGATYGEMKEKIDTLLPRFADHRARLEEMAEALRREEKALEKAKKEARREEVARLEKRIKKLKEALEEELKKEREERAYLEKRVKELSEELKAKKVKLRFLKDYPPFYKAGMTIETADLPWAFELINSGVAEYVLPPKPKVEVAPVRMGLGHAEKQRLETRFFAELARRGIGVDEAKKRGYYQMFLDEFERWRGEFKNVPSEEALETSMKLLGSLVDEIEKIHKAPKPRLLPPIPEKCPIDGTPLRQVKKLPIGPIPIRLSAEEEELRARMGLPIPKYEMVEIEIPPTMRVFACEKDHLFELVDTRLVQRTPEFIYRKVIRETAKIRGLLKARAPPVVEVGVRPIFRPEIIKTTRDAFTWWLEKVKKIDRWEFLKMDEEARKKLRDEWIKWMMGEGG
ncbi:hypothetical protein DRO53_05130 [Candidatus Bathyarchaeota archaeon]|nr:MAG: hypothetical protein DRO53_05130 [Candidatus Bathyarchaeota archaeon]